MQAHHAAQKKAQKRKHAQERQKVRYEKLAKRNPVRLERQVNAYKSIPEEMRTDHEKKQLDELEKELKSILKAKKEMGLETEEDRQPKKKRDDEESDYSDTDDEARDIPLPPGPLPPLPGQEEKKQIVYEAKPVLRDLRKEAAKFVPTHIALKQKAGSMVPPSEGTNQNEEKMKEKEKGKEDDAVEDELSKFEKELEEVQAVAED